jgi:predicted DNA-binding ribbon-helix-helix protein
MSDVSKTTINLDKSMKKELKKIAIDEDTSLSGLILKMIEEAMENRKT